MLKALLLILEPMSTWDKIFRARRGAVFILGVYLLPLLLVTSAVEGYSLVHWGRKRGETQELAQTKRFTCGEAVTFETAQMLLSLVVVLVSASIVNSIGQTFYGHRTFVQALSAVAYGLSPLFLLRLLDFFPGINPWVSWSIGIVLSLKVLYQGVPRMMEPDPSFAFALFVVSSLVVIIITGLLRFMTWWYLIGKLSQLDDLISGLAARLPF